MRVSDFPVFGTYDEILQHARKLVAKFFEDHVIGLGEDDMFYTGFVRSDLADAMFADQMTYQDAVDIVKTNPVILRAQVEDRPSVPDDFIFAAIAETVIQDLHTEFQSRAQALFDAAEARREAEDAPGI